MMATISGTNTPNSYTLTFQVAPNSGELSAVLVCTTPAGERFTLTEFDPSAEPVRQIEQ